MDFISYMSPVFTILVWLNLILIVYYTYTYKKHTFAESFKELATCRYKNSLDAGIQDTKHEYLDSGQIWLTVTEGKNGDESDKRK